MQTLVATSQTDFPATVFPVLCIFIQHCISNGTSVAVASSSTPLCTVLKRVNYQEDPVFAFTLVQIFITICEIATLHIQLIPRQPSSELSLELFPDIYSFSHPMTLLQYTYSFTFLYTAGEGYDTKKESKDIST